MNTKYCKKCGKELPTEASFCPYCMTMQIEKKTADTQNHSKKKHLLIISICGLLVVSIIIAGIVFVINTHKPTDEHELTLASSPNEITTSENVLATASSTELTTSEISSDYSDYIGLWCDKDKTTDEVTTNGGNMLEIISVNHDTIRFSFTKISSNSNRIARIQNVNCKLIDGTGTFTFDNDDWSNSGSGKIKLNDGEIYLEANVTKPDSSAMWSINGNVYLYKSEASTIWINDDLLNKDFDSVKNQFGEVVSQSEIYASNLIDYEFPQLTVTVKTTNNEVKQIKADYSNQFTKKVVQYQGIDGNSNYDDVYSQFGEPYENRISNGYVRYKINDGFLMFYFSDDLYVKEIILTSTSLTDMGENKD